MTYWPEKGKQNTAGTINEALTRAGELGIENLVVASGTGSSALMLAGKGPAVVCVTRQYGFSGPGEFEMDSAVKKQLEGSGVKILTTTHLLAGVDRALRFKFQGVYPAEIIASTLKLFGQGLKVCVEVSVMALDAGLVPHSSEIIALAGSGKGLDTAAVILPAHSQYFFDTVVKEIICMPREK